MKLGVNVDHVATIRQARGGIFPSPVEAALICEKAGADSIVMHLREDRRHIQDKDIFEAKKKLKTRLNMEMSIEASVVKIAAEARPHQVTLVPEKRMERTTESGLNLKVNFSKISKVAEFLTEKNIEVSLFIDPDFDQVKLAQKMKVPAIEFHTGTYAFQSTVKGFKKELVRLAEAAKLAKSLGLITHAGHGLDYKNVKAMHSVNSLTELNIGYSIISRALWVGLDRAVREMKELVRE